MPSFAYRARNESGKAVEGIMEALSRDDLVQRLHKMGYLTTQVKEKSAGGPGGAGLNLNVDLLGPFEKIGIEQMIFFTVQLANLINAGIPLLGSLRALSDQTRHRKLKKTVDEISKNVEAGEGLSDSLARHPKIFNKLFLSMVRAGEASGKLGLVLERLAEFTEKEADLKQKIASALAYPVLVLCTGFAVAIFISSAILPKFVEIFVRAKVKLPMATEILYRFGNAVRSYWYLMLIGLAVAIVLFKLYVGTKQGRYAFDRFRLKMPLFGPLFQKAGVSRFARTFSMLFGSGVPILQCIQLSQDVLGNEVLARVVGDSRLAVEKGEKISDALKVSSFFPTDMLQMLTVGEETGELEQILGKVAELYDKTVQYAIKRLAVMIEPILLIILGIIIGTIMAAMILPIFDMVKVLRGGSI